MVSIHVSLPRELYKALERACDEAGTTPSALIRESLKIWLNKKGYYGEKEEKGRS